MGPPRRVAESRMRSATRRGPRSCNGAAAQRRRAIGGNSDNGCVVRLQWGRRASAAEARWGRYWFGGPSALQWGRRAGWPGEDPGGGPGAGVLSQLDNLVIRN
ncbi:MAG: hypothetical protein MZU84_00775, partial [Sphingobacterium sp.]|nr:hypothetical protein [Sphingobacterium sp.]